ncbi:MAG TPA: hypothetical protein PLZ57_07775 [Pseudobdellovibrionaceae bacterium]|nr:hypothetical protein [Pseudobdellovibrionaceae bacterium]
MSADPQASPAIESQEFKAFIAKLPRNIFLIFVGAGLINSFWPKAEPWVTLAVIVMVFRGVFKLLRGLSANSATIRSRLAQTADGHSASGPSHQPNLDEMLVQFPDLNSGHASQTEWIEARRRQLAEAKRRTQLEAQAMRQRVKAKQQASAKSRPRAESVVAPGAPLAQENHRHISHQIDHQIEPSRRSAKASVTRQPITGRKRAVRKKRQGSARPSNMDSKIF